jgi:hypothetical protein
MDGVDLAREVKKQWPHLTMVLSSRDRDQRVESLADDIIILRKPWPALDVLMIAERARSTVLERFLARNS